MRDLSRFQAWLLVSIVVASASAAVAKEAVSIRPGRSHCRTEEVIEYRDVVVQRCKMVPAKKVTKKTVYEVKEVPFCLHKPSLPLGCDCCPQCQSCARTKKVLVKKEVTHEEPCGTRCEVEEVVERQAFKVCRLVPCGNCLGACVASPSALPSGAPLEQIPAPVAE